MQVMSRKARQFIYPTLASVSKHSERCDVEEVVDGEHDLLQGQLRYGVN